MPGDGRTCPFSMRSRSTLIREAVNSLLPCSPVDGADQHLPLRGRAIDAGCLNRPKVEYQFLPVPTLSQNAWCLPDSRTRQSTYPFYCPSPPSDILPFTSLSISGRKTGNGSHLTLGWRWNARRAIQVAMGWLIPGTSPESRKTVEMWAVLGYGPWDAAAALGETAGVSDLPTVTLCELSDDHMRSLGLTEEGQIARVRCIF